MLHRLLRIGLLLFVVGVVCSIAVVSTTSRATALPLPPGKTFSIPVIESLRPEPDRIPVTPSVSDRTALGKLPAGVGVGTIPPGTPRPLKTNAWWSGGALEAWPAPVFPLPFKGIFNTTGLILTVPGRRVQDKTIFMTDGEPLRIFAQTAPTGASEIIAGDWDVTFRVRGAAGPLFDATFIQGSPYVFVRSTSTLSLALPASATTSPVPCGTDCASALLVKTPASTYLLVSPVRDAFTVQGSIVSVRFETGRGLLTIAAVAPGSDPALYLAAAMRPYTGTIATWSMNASDVFTVFRFPVPTIMGILPHQFASLAYIKDGDAPAPFIQGNPGKVIGSFMTVRGPLRLYSGQGFRTAVPRPSILPSLPPLPAVAKDPALHALLKREIMENAPPAGDTYNAGKALRRTAQLAELADALREGELWKLAVAQAKTSLIEACTAKPGPGMALYFSYDPNAGGIIAFPQGFGSEHYNDHHFHVGYILHAAAIVTRYDPSFAQEYGDCMRLLIRDIASSDRNDPSFPYLRYFDPYGGHSWANGLTLFADGTNQESESEALQAWYAMALYGRTTGSKNLEELGTWMYAQEAQAARMYWLNTVPASGAVPPEFPYPMISLLWSGKADYATWFDGSDAAIRGIQFFPVSVSLLPFLDRETVTRLVAPIADSAAPGIWKTGLTLIAGIFNPAKTVPADWAIDPALSRTFVEYWQRAFQSLGQPVGATGSCFGHVFQNGKKITAVVYRFSQDPLTCNFTLGKRAVSLPKLNVGWNLRAL